MVFLAAILAVLTLVVIALAHGLLAAQKDLRDTRRELMLARINLAAERQRHQRTADDLGDRLLLLDRTAKRRRC